MDLVVDELTIIVLEVSDCSHLDVSLLLVLFELPDGILPFAMESPALLDWNTDCLDCL